MLYSSSIRASFKGTYLKPVNGLGYFIFLQKDDILAIIANLFVNTGFIGYFSLTFYLNYAILTLSQRHANSVVELNFAFHTVSLINFFLHSNGKRNYQKTDRSWFRLYRS